MGNWTRNRTVFGGFAGLAALSLFCSAGFAQQAQDACDAAEELGPGDYVLDLTQATSEFTYTGICGGSAANADLWIKFVAPVAGTLNVATCNSPNATGTFPDTVLSLHSGCNQPAIVCNDDACGFRSTVVADLAAGQEVFIRASKFGASVSYADALLTISFAETGGEPPANDLCNAATAANGPGLYDFDTTTATLDGTATCFANTVKDVWFQYTPAASGAAVFSTCGGLAGFNTVISVFDSCGGVQLGCNNDGPAAFGCGTGSRVAVSGTVAGTPVWVRVAGSAAGQFGAGQLEVTEIEGGIPGDLCTDAVDVMGPGSYPFDNTIVGTEGPNATCGFGGATGGSDVFFDYVPAISGVAIVDTCGSFDTILQAFDTDCSGAQVGCNDDSCGLSSSMSFQVIAGNHYAIRLSGWQGATGAGNLNINELPPVANDNCSSAAVAVTGSNGFDTTGSTTELAASCVGSNNDVWFTYTTARAGSLVVDTCGSAIDTVLTVYDACGGTELRCNDDAGALSNCGGTLQSSISLPVENEQTFFIRVAGFGNASGAGNLNIDVVDPLVSCITQPEGSTPEDEACGDDVNGGCNTAAQSFFDVSAGQTTIFGNSFSNEALRDTDWYRLPNTGALRLNATLQADFPANLIIANVTTCPATIVQVIGAPTRCTDIATYMGNLGEGSYAIVIANQGFGGFDCGTVNNYVLTIDAVAVGACCTAEGCSIKSGAECAAVEGTYQGDGSGCGGYNAAEESTNAFDSIAGFGNQGPAADDVNITVDIGFDFQFYGETFSQVGFCSNGFLQFGGNAATFVNGAIPSAAIPNNAIYGLWDDLLPGAGVCFYATSGDAPTRKFTAEWNACPQFGGGGGPVTFQIVLFEGSNEIELRYGDIPADVGGDYTIGVENADGTIAKTVDSTTIGAGQTSRKFTIASTCDGGEPCNIDFNNDGIVEPGDLDDFITAFFAGC
ncbi:MAG: hypothetical protein ACT4PL_04865 [Phycisphaerales bacterium]